MSVWQQLLLQRLQAALMLMLQRQPALLLQMLSSNILARLLVAVLPMLLVLR
jgi:hypothetical protein